MTKVVIDTNVPIVSNDRDGDYPEGCPIRCIDRLARVRNGETVVLDYGGEILKEYRRHLRSEGQPGPGDAFYLHVLRHAGDGIRTWMVEISDEQLPEDNRLISFDRADRKFAVAARAANAVVLNAVDEGWRTHRDVLAEYDVIVEFVCD